MVKSSSIAALLMAFAVLQVNGTSVSYKTRHNAAGCAASSVKREGFESVGACERTTCDDGAACYEKRTCNSTHVTKLWYTDAQCTTVIDRDDDVSPLACTETIAGEVWEKTVCGYATTDMSSRHFSGLWCAAANLQAEQAAYLISCRKDGSYEEQFTNGVRTLTWTDRSESFSVGTSVVRNEYNSLDCSGTQRGTTMTLPCGSCYDSSDPDNEWSIIINCGGRRGTASISAHTSPWTATAFAAAASIAAAWRMAG